ncbi:hypothetical protein BDR04DRAFT_1100216, partial [Suillus decipiens]
IPVTNAPLHRMTQVQIETSRLGTKDFVLDENVNNPCRNFKAHIPTYPPLPTHLLCGGSA